MTTPILLTGGTGTLGRLVAPLLLDTGRSVRLLSRHQHEPSDGIGYVTGDLLTGEGIDSAVEGAEIVLHLAGAPKSDDVAASKLVRAASRAGVQHLVNISVIGADRVPLGYFKSKWAAEQAIAASDVPWTTLRAAQFHDFVLTMVEQLTKLSVVPVPTAIRLQSVEAAEVAVRLVELTLGAPAGLVPDLAGPAVFGAADAIRGYLAASGKHRPLMPVRVPGKAGRAYRAAENLALAGADVGKRTWDEFLAERVAGQRG